MRRKTVVGVVLAMTAASLLAAWAPAIASAAGGKSIATAPLVTYGQQEFGNTAEDQYLEESCGFADAWRSYWSLPVTAGDLVTINWEGSKGTELKLAPLGTTDFTLFSVDPALSQELSSNGKAQAQYTVPQSGTMPLYFRVCSGAAQPGPYNFIATAQHGLAVSLTPPPSTIQTNSVLTGTARLASGAAVPDGLVFTLSAVGQFGTATYTAASSGGALSFPLALPATAAGQSVAMTISRPADAEYLEAKSSEATATVAAVPPSPVPAPVHKVAPHRKPLKCSRHFKKRKIRGKAKCVRVGKKHHGQGQRRHRHLRA